DQNILTRNAPHSLQRLDQHRMRIDERGPAVNHFDVVPGQCVPDDLDLALDDAPHVADQLLHRGPEVRPEMTRGFDAGGGIIPADRLAKGFRRNRAGLDAHPPDAPLFFDDSDPLAELRSLNGGPLPGRSAADADEVDVIRALGHTAPRFE